MTRSNRESTTHRRLLSIVSGGMDTINSEAEKNFPAIREQYERKDPQVLLLSRFVGLFLLNLPCADEDDTD